jgi:hypothetical protein
VLRTVFCCALIFAIDIPCWAQEKTVARETVIRLNVSAAPAPKPALRYLLLPELKEMNPGNPIHNYLKCFMEQQKFFFDKEAFDRRDKLLAMPLKELPVRDLEEYGRVALAQADWAARLDNPDWQILLKLKSDGIGVLLPDLPELRILANALKVRFRAEIAEGRFDDGIRTAKTLFAMARHLGEHPTYVGNLVGIAVAAVAMGPLEEMLELKGCPNLYWALTNLPTPLVSLEKGTQGERLWVVAEFQDLNVAGPMTEDQLVRFVTRLDQKLGPDKPKEGLQAWLSARAGDEKRISDARRRLVESGLSETVVPRFPPLQVILLDEKREYEARRDDQMKIFNLPAWQFEAIESQIEPSKERPLFDLAPALRKVRQAQTRLDQRIGLLRLVEALRIYAAEHNGTLPAALTEVTVPLPDDPFTGKAFRYEKTGDTAHLRGSPPPDRQKEPPFNMHFELRIAK